MPAATARTTTSTTVSPNLPDLRERTNREFVSVAEVARVTGYTDRHLRRLCATDLVNSGQARQVNGKWRIHRSFDKRLAEAMRNGEFAPPIDLSQYPADKVRRARIKADVVRDYRRLRASGAHLATATPEFVNQQLAKHGDDLGRLSVRSIQRWDADAPPSDQFDLMIEHFIDNRGRGPTAGVAVSQEAWDEFEAVYLNRNKWSISHAWRHVKALAHEYGWTWCSKRHCERLVKQRIDPSRACMAREGLKVWQSTYGVTLPQNPDAWKAGELWVADHAKLDFFVRVMRGGRWVAVRAQVTSIIDWRTRMWLGWWIDESPSSETIRLALHRAITVHGGPSKHIWIDNGKDFASKTLTGLTKKERREIMKSGGDWVERTIGIGLFQLLGMTPHFALPYNHNGKSRKERAYGTMHEYFCKTFDSYCGASVGDVEIPASIAKHPEKLPTIDEARERFEKSFLPFYNHQTDHSVEDLRDDDGRTLSRAEAMRSWCETIPHLANPDALNLLLKHWERPKKVSKKRGIGIRVSGKTIWYGSGDPVLEPFKGSDRLVHIAYDPDNMASIHVYDSQYRFLTVATCNELYGGNDEISRRALVEGLARKRAHERAVRESIKGSRIGWSSAVQVGLDVMREQSIDEAKSREGNGIAPPPDETSPRLIQTPVDDQVKAVQMAEFRQAAGGEFDDRTNDDDGLDDLCDLSDLAPASFSFESARDRFGDDDDDDFGSLEDLACVRPAGGEEDDDDDDELHPLDSLTPFSLHRPDEQDQDEADEEEEIE